MGKAHNHESCMFFEPDKIVICGRDEEWVRNRQKVRGGGYETSWENSQGSIDVIDITPL